ncbi:MAG: hypothetical protein LBK41_00105 [Clostridiales bacterium]|jgi:hypothetical protein|nr:hypothetical protein [Clostridiales bacterium]
MSLAAVSTALDRRKTARLALYAVSAVCAVSVLITRVQPESAADITGCALAPAFSVYPYVRGDAA